jgi:hypothetical protein
VLVLPEETPLAPEVVLNVLGHWDNILFILPHRLQQFRRVTLRTMRRSERQPSHLLFAGRILDLVAKWGLGEVQQMHNKLSGVDDVVSGTADLFVNLRRD